MFQDDDMIWSVVLDGVDPFHQHGAPDPGYILLLDPEEGDKLECVLVKYQPLVIGLVQTGSQGLLDVTTLLERQKNFTCAKFNWCQ